LTAEEAHDEAHREKEQIQTTFPAVSSAANHCHDHEHGWAPWRYGVLLLPVMLYLLRLPNESFGVTAGAAVQRDPTKDAAKASTLIASFQSPLQRIVLGAVVMGGRIENVDFKELQAVANSDPEEQKQWIGRNVRLKGQFAMRPGIDRQFSLVRFKITCCSADAIQLHVVFLCDESVANLHTQNTWVEVTGQINSFVPDAEGNKVTVLRVASRKDIKQTKPDQNPYLQ
jgi:uncharacterized repeat protein (TIGR03943 family)